MTRPLLLPLLLSLSLPIGKAQFGPTWPFTVDRGELRCEVQGQRQFVVFRVNGIDYGVNGSAKQFGGYKPADAVTLRAGRDAPKKVVSRIPEPRRRAAFAALAACDAVMEEKSEERCRAGVRNKFQLSAAEVDLIGDEGVALVWPPLPPAPMMDVGPIIKRGLTLCSAGR